MLLIKFFALATVINCNKENSLIKDYSLLLYPHLPNEYQYKKPIDTYKGTIGSYLSLEEDTSIFVLLYLQSEDVLKKKINNLINKNTVYLTSTQINLQIEHQPYPLMIKHFSFNKNFNLFNKDLQSYKYIGNKTSIENSIIKKHEVYNIKLTEKEKEIFFLTVKKNNRIKYLIFLLENFDEIYTNFFLMFSPVNGKILDLKDSKTIIEQQIILFIYKAIREDLY